MKIAYISTYPPRECGLATFNQNLVNALSLNPTYDSQKSFVIALNESDDLKEHHYPNEVKFIIRQQNQQDYINAADFINKSDVQTCIIEHEFGIYGGNSGVFLLSLINRLKKPFITILHTVLKEPNFMQQTIIKEIASKSAKLVVMSKKAVMFLSSVYQIPKTSIKLIEHGVPDLEPVVNNEIARTELFRGKKVLFTFGLISRNKGLETVIKALPNIVAQHPDILYVILGNTHPGVVKHNGEEYRDSLKALAKDLGVANNIAFVNKFVSEEELHQYLTACYLYITPYLNEAQITSGTLSYAIGAGAAVVSTPYWHAQELLADNRGRLFDFKNDAQLANIINELLSDQDKYQKLRQNAYQYGLSLRWPAIGNVYLNVLNEALLTETKVERIIPPIIDVESMPILNLNHISLLTDDTGIIQHARFGIPNLKEGYCIDDNARALIMTIMAVEQDKNPTALKFMPVYLSFIQYMQTEDGNFRNFLSFNRQYLDEVGSEDSFGRTIWALGYLVCSAPNNSYREFGKELFSHSIIHFNKLKYLRGKANTIIGLSYYLCAHPGDELITNEIDQLAIALVTSYNENKEDNWHWFEDILTYDNAILPLALLHHYDVTGNVESYKVAMESIEFLNGFSFENGYLNPVGNAGWMKKHGKNPIYDQQAIETMAMVLLYAKAFEITKDDKYLNLMHISYKWFLGKNSLHIPLYDYETHGCADGLQFNSVNRNQGAESTLAYFISHLAILKAAEAEYETLSSPLVEANKCN
ncbi:glycosyltransferase involved in cell wall biosynthesis [Pedobacter sp. AK013]|uniref:glycosyltransferase family 4 protein n=1 Tax=Pedobacter sp. AK013 TaxID=2723071 RepID=UPI001616E5C5|nr:glycosyltransferase family 4 protein [Pedobacter sp. AK013]MBB6235927.1 glycosyltransferase involved in cell wall biosynthesis [Pedobacter sp. AK013]